MCAKLWRVWGDIWWRGGAIRIRWAEAQRISAQYTGHYEQYSRVTNKFDLVHLSKFTQPSWFRMWKFDGIWIWRRRRLADRSSPSGGTRIEKIGRRSSRLEETRRQRERFVAIPRDRPDRNAADHRQRVGPKLSNEKSLDLIEISTDVQVCWPRNAPGPNGGGKKKKKKRKKIAAFCEIPFFSVGRRAS